jgi:hypothetical protein
VGLQSAMPWNLTLFTSFMARAAYPPWLRLC